MDRPEHRSLQLVVVVPHIRLKIRRKESFFFAIPRVSRRVGLTRDITTYNSTLVVPH